MKILFIIDNFGSGGAQRQMVNLACGLKGRGHDVAFFIYYPQYSFFREIVEKAQIPVYDYQKTTRFSLGVIKSLVGLVRRQKYDIVLSFLDTPNTYAEISSLFYSGVKTVVSERSSHRGDKSIIGAHLRRQLHRLADFIVTNSHSHQAWLQSHYSWLSKKCTTIYNGLDVTAFNAVSTYFDDPKSMRLIAIGKVEPVKNAINLIRGLACFYQKHGWSPGLSWVGRRTVNNKIGQAYSSQVDDLLEAFPEIKKQWEWLGERSDIPQLLASHHALIHPSFYEGLPNVICEALAAGCPVLASRVCDHELLVEDGRRGYLFDPGSDVDICKAIEQLAFLDREAWNAMSTAARKYAKENLSIDSLVDAYERLFRSIIIKKDILSHGK